MLRLWLTLVILIGLLNSCLREFDNPIDPELADSVPPTPQNLQLSIIPYEDTKVYRGHFDYAWENAQGMIIERSTSDSFAVIDTLYAPHLDFSDSRPLNDSVDYAYRVVAFNVNGLSAYSGEVHADATDSLDLFPPQIKPWHADNPMPDFKTVQDSILELRFRVIDESALAYFVVNGDSLSINEAGWAVYYDTLRAYSQRYVYEAADASEFARSTKDSFSVYYDYDNAGVQLNVYEDGEDVIWAWDRHADVDFVSYELRFAESGMPDINGTADYSTANPDELEYTLEGVSDNIWALAVLRDSAGNVNYGSNSLIRRVDGRWYRQGTTWIDAGSFVDVYGAHAQISRGFWIDTTEVTQEKFLSVMSYLSSFFSGSQKPAEGVSWLDALRYCNALSLAEGFDTVYSYELISGSEVSDLDVAWDVVGYRLPTADEWELAARGGQDTLPYLWGLTSGHAEVDEYAWYERNAGGVMDTLPRALENGPQVVAYKKPNSYGLYDVHGNIGEWVWDYYVVSDEERNDGRVDYRGVSECTLDNGCMREGDEISGADDYYRSYKGGGWINSVNNLNLSVAQGSGQHIRGWMTGLRPVINRPVREVH